MAGMLEKEPGPGGGTSETFFNTYIVVSPAGFVTKQRKLHAFINPHLSSGDASRGRVCH